MKKKTIAMLMASVMLFGIAVGGTLAWITDTTGDVVNTFTVGDINIDLKEHDYDVDTNTLGTAEVTAEDEYKMIPGTTMPKDPFVRVEAGSEACWLFVKVVETDNFDTYLTYEIDLYKEETNPDGWKVLDTTNYPGVYYREVESLVNATSDSDPYYVLADNQVSVKEGVTKTQLEDFDGKDSNGASAPAEITARPKLTFTAYAVQKAEVDTAMDAWEILFPPTTTN